MINPNQLVVWKQKFLDRAHGKKYYRAGFDLQSGYSNFSRRVFGTATEAMDYGKRVKARWIRLYNAAVLAMMTTQEPAP